MFGEERKKQKPITLVRAKGLWSVPLNATSRIGMGYNTRVTKRNRFFMNQNFKNRWGRDSGLNLLHSNF